MVIERWGETISIVFSPWHNSLSFVWKWHCLFKRKQFSPSLILIPDYKGSSLVSIVTNVLFNSVNLHFPRTAFPFFKACLNSLQTMEISLVLTRKWPLYLFIQNNHSIIHVIVFWFSYHPVVSNPSISSSCVLRELAFTQHHPGIIILFMEDNTQKWSFLFSCQWPTFCKCKKWLFPSRFCLWASKNL